MSQMIAAEREGSQRARRYETPAARLLSVSSIDRSFFPGKPMPGVRMERHRPGMDPLRDLPAVHQARGVDGVRTTAMLVAHLRDVSALRRYRPPSARRLHALGNQVADACDLHIA
jgi:hypothetical protein